MFGRVAGDASCVHYLLETVGMDKIDAIALAQQWANDVLIWVGFGTIVGLAAKAIMPGRDPGGAVATLAMGVGGSIIGCGTRVTGR